MAYEDMTYEVIIKRMMERIKAKHPNLDDREGSLLYDACAAAAVEMAVMYTELDNTLNEMSVSTASREWMLIGCRDRGMDITAFEASYGVHKGVFNVQVEIGSRWNCDLYNYEVTEYLGLEDGYHAYRMVCETAGSAPNNLTGDLIAITDIPSDLTYAEVIECLIEGENETSDEDIRTAYYEYVNSTVSDGNKDQYKKWCNDYDGIGRSKVTPLWNGANTVKVSILSSSNRAASDELVAEFQEYLDPGVTGMGDGVAPIGAFVTVTTAQEIPIAVSANVTMKSGYEDTSGINTALTNYFSSIAYEKSQVSYMSVGATILNVQGVDSISNLTINGLSEDLSLNTDEIPVLSVGNWTVI